MSYPTTIVDNFFDKPDLIFEKISNLKFLESNGKYPGARSGDLKLIDPELFNEFAHRLLGLFYERTQGAFMIDANIQRIFPFSEKNTQK